MELILEYVTGFGSEKVECEPNLIAKMVREVSELVEKCLMMFQHLVKYLSILNDILQ